MRVFTPMSVAALVLGSGYAVWTIVTVSHVTNSSVLLIVLGVVVFLLGLVSEQISTMRFERRDVEPVPTYKEPHASPPARRPASTDRDQG
jgi:hypothetical protein